MKPNAWLSRCGILCAAVGILVSGMGSVNGQPAPPTPAPVSSAAPTPSGNDVLQTELLRNYLQLRDQLQSTQISLARDRAEHEAAARLQSSLFAEKLDALKVALESDRERLRAETERLTAERERQQAANERTYRLVLWVAAAFGLTGLAALCVLPFFQWKLMRRTAEPAVVPVSPTPQLAAPPAAPLLQAAASVTPGMEAAVRASSQRLGSVIERLERRILELEDTSKPASLPAPPSPATLAVNGHGDPDAARRAAAAAAEAEKQARINDLMGKGRALLASSKPREAIECFDEVLKLSPKHADALIKKGSALERLTRDEEAIRYYDHALSIDRSLTLAYLYKGGVCNRLGRYDEAMECYEQALLNEESR